MILQRTIYPVGLFLWSIYVLIFPTWIGRCYPDASSPSWQMNRFDLRGAGGERSVAPIWSPPMADDDKIHPSVRWPWQSPGQLNHVELYTAFILMRWSAGVVVLGLTCPIINWIRPLEKPDAMVSIGWTVSLFLVFAWVCLILLFTVSTGQAVTDMIIISVLSISTLAGLTFGIDTYWRRLF